MYKSQNVQIMCFTLDLYYFFAQVTDLMIG